MKFIYYTSLLFTLFSCKQKNSISENIVNVNNTYKQITINCLGEEYAPSSCKNEAKQITLTFLNNDSNTIVNIKHKEQNFIHNINEQIDNLGLKSYLFEKDEKMILILDSFLEYGHKFYIYQIEDNVVRFLNSKEFDSKFDEKEIEIKYDFIISEDQSFINLKLGSIYEDISLNIENSKVLPLNTTTLQNNDINSDFSGLWKLNCDSELLIFEVSNDKVYMFLNSDNSIYINALIKKMEGKDNAFGLYFVNTESQNEFYEEIGNVNDKEISKDKNIASITLTSDSKIELNWIGLYNAKLKKIEFLNEFVFLKENSNMNPIFLNKCK